jgi:hypothetical protein
MPSRKVSHQEMEEFENTPDAKFEMVVIDYPGQPVYAKERLRGHEHYEYKRCVGWTPPRQSLGIMRYNYRVEDGVHVLEKVGGAEVLDFMGYMRDEGPYRVLPCATEGVVANDNRFPLPRIEEAGYWKLLWKNYGGERVTDDYD